MIALFLLTPILILAVLALLGFVGCYTPAHLSTGWSYQKAITIQGALVTGMLNGFPVLISLPGDTDLAASAQSNGNDIKFLLADGVTQLNHEIESYDPTTGQLVAWVQVPML